jgi:hypothetical protein
MEYQLNNDKLILPDITKSSRLSRENGASKSYSYIEDDDYPYNKLYNSEANKYDTSVFDYAEAFNQIKNAKFKVLSKIEKLKMAKNPNNNNDYEDFQENYNQVYNYLNDENKVFTKYSNGNLT